MVIDGRVQQSCSALIDDLLLESGSDGLLEDDGIANGGNAQNCVQVCPMSMPLTRAIYETNRDITVNALFGWLKK